jgi:hypothetical protein
MLEAPVLSVFNAENEWLSLCRKEFTTVQIVKSA